MTVEREGPGDNGPVGKADHRCIEAGTYPLRSHNTENYTTIGFATDGDHPRPALEVGDTAARVGILVHPASGYGSTIGCINLAGSLDDADFDFSLSDSTARVVAVINDLKRHNGGTLPHDGAIGDCRLIVVDASIDQLGRQALRFRIARAARQELAGFPRRPRISTSARAALMAASAPPRARPRSPSRTPMTWRQTAPLGPGRSPLRDNSASVRQRHREPWPGLLRRRSTRQ